MGYKLGYKPKRGFRKWWPHTVALVGVFALGAATASFFTPAVNKHITSVEKDNNIVRVAGMGHNADIFAPQNPDETSDKRLQGVSDIRSSSACGNLSPPRTSLASANTPLLRKLASYEQLCDGAAVERMMFFVGTPKDINEARSYGSWVADVLRDFSTHKVKPLVILEPTLSTGGTVDFKQYRNGAYDPILEAYFAAIKEKGITDEMMGVWVPFPEGNIPVWPSVDPGDFAANVTKTVQIQKKYFPESKASILLESKTYPSATTWAGGTFVSLLPYVQDIPANLIDSFGLQGFAWPPTSAGDEPTLNPKEFLRVDFAMETARALGARDIWLNTGTFNVSYVTGRDNPFSLTPGSRQEVLDGILQQAKLIESQGFSANVHIFAKDKSGVPEGIDWSYWPADGAPSGASADVFKTFVHDVTAAGVPLWLFDSES